jgi:DNA-binding NarL/FixJ family response regulator
VRILISEMAPARRAQLRYALGREPWVTAALSDVPDAAFDDPGGSYEPYPAAVGDVAPAGDLTGRVAAARPDLLLLDWDLAAPLPAGTLESLKTSFPRVLVAAVSTHPDERAAALAAGIDLFLAGDGTPQGVVDGLRAALMPNPGR